MIMEIIITGLNVVLHYIELTVVEQGQVGDYMLIEDLRLAHFQFMRPSHTGVQSFAAHEQRNQ